MDMLLIGAEGGIALFPDESELIWGLVAFLLLMLLMSKFVFPRANAALEERREAIQGRMEDADAKLQEAEEARRSYEASIADARGEANRIVDEARTTAESVRADIVAKAEDEAAAIVDRARADIASERERVLQELRTQLGEVSVQLAARIVERELDPSTHEGLVDEYIQQLSSTN